MRAAGWSGRRTTIRTKVTLALLVLALIPLALASLVAYRSARQSSEREAIDRLAGIAAVQEARVNAYAASSLENLALVASRTQLRISFQAQLDDPHDDNISLMQRILGDAVGSSATALRIELLDLEGQVVVASDGVGVGFDRSGELAFLRGRDGPDISNITERDGARMGIHTGPVSLDDRQLGVVLIEASLDPLDRLMSDYTGLGQSGETILASSLDLESVELLGPVRFPEELEDETIIDRDLLARALAGVEGVVSDQEDYRSEDVLAVVRAVERVPGWALAVKIDRSEALADANRLGTVLLVTFGAAVLAVLVGASVLARALSRPVVELHAAATAVAGGVTGRRADVRSNDELAELATQFNRMTDDLVDANARLTLTNEQLEEFVYISSHDLKSPLRTVASFSQLLQAGYSDGMDETGREYLAFIRDGTGRMHRVIDDLLDYLRIEKVGHVVEAVDLAALLDDICQLHGPEIKRSGAIVNCENLPTVQGSAALLRQLFDNLIQNTIRYRRDDQTLVVNISAVREPDAWVITVADNGKGVPPDRRELTFSPFKRLSEEGDGSGMGLAICRRIAKRHQGDITMADSELGGVSLVVTLPAEGTGDTRDAVS